MAKTTLDILSEVVRQFKAGNYDAVQKLLNDKSYKAIVTAEQDEKLRDSVVSVFEHMGIAVSERVSSRLNDGLLGTIDITINPVQEKITAGKCTAINVNMLAKALDSCVHNISNTMKQQAEALTIHEQELFDDKGAFAYAGDLIKSRWSGEHHAGDKIIIPPPSPKLREKTITLEGKALEEFGNVRLLDDAWKKAGAIIGTVAGVGIVAHGARNIYLAINPNENEQLEVAELGHEKTNDGINWLRLVVGAGEVGVGGLVVVRQVTGRNAWDLRNSVVGNHTELCNHEKPAANAGRGA